MTDHPDHLNSPPGTAPTLGQSPVFTSYQSRLLARSNSGLLSRSRSNSKDLANLLASPPASPRKLGSGSAAALALSGAKVGRGDQGDKPKGHARAAKSVDLVRGQWEQRAAETAADPELIANGITPNSTTSQVSNRKALWEQHTGNEPSSPVAASPTHRRSRSVLPPSLKNDFTGSSTASTTATVTPVTLPITVASKPAIGLGLGKPPRAPTAKEDPLQEIARQVSNSHSKRYPSSSELGFNRDLTATTAISPNLTGSSIAASETSTGAAPKYKSAYMAQRAAKRASASSLASQYTGESDTGSATPRASRARPLSLVGAARTPLEDTSHLTAEERLVIARANALKRLEAKQRANGAIASDSERTSTTIVTSTTPEIQALETPSSLAAIFTPPRPDSPPAPVVAAESIPQLPKSTYRSIVTPPSAPAVSSSYVSSPESGSGKYGSISRTDKRKLGRHLPRIASGDAFEDDKAEAVVEAVNVETLAPPPASSPRPSGLSRPHIPSGLSNSFTATPSAIKPGRFAATARLPTSAPRQTSRDAFETPTKVAPNYTGGTPTFAKRRSANVGLTSPKIELDGEGMRGLMSAVGGGAARGAEVDEEEGVVGIKGRLRLSRLPLPASSAALAPAPLPSRRLMQNTNWMDRQRHALAAYEYLCHVGEAQQWIEGCLDEELGFGVTEMEEGLRDGVVLARLAKVYEGDSVKIWTEAKHRFRQSDNINFFLSFVRNAGLPETFIFELTDLYDKKNIPKVIYCVHVLSHLLARQGRADRISNLVGQFEFTDEQLAATQKGLQGVAMPNFGSVGNALAKDMKWAEEEEVETEDERRDRELLACQAVIVDLQSHLRGRIARMRASRIYAQLDLAQPIISRFQARARGAICRRALIAERDARANLDDWVAAVQAAVRRQIARSRWQARPSVIGSNNDVAKGIQAQARGRLQRDKLRHQQNQLRAGASTTVALQAAARANLARKHSRELVGTFHRPEVANSVTTLQAAIRGRLQRQAISKQSQVLAAHQAVYSNLQSQIRGAMIRRGRRVREQKLDDASDVIIFIQATARGALTRRRHAAMVRDLKQTTAGVTTFQAAARARLAKQSHKGMQKALAKVELAGTVGGLQAFLRTKLAKKSTTEQKKQLEFLAPDVIGFQAAARGCLQRREFAEWRDYLVEPHTQGALIFLQSLIRGFLARRRLWIRTSYIHSNIPSIVKVQALQRGRVQRQLFEKLMTGSGVDVPTIQNYMHLLDDTEGDFREQVAIDTLRQQTVQLIRENQVLEADVQELDTKIALVLNNKFTFEDLVRAKRRTGGAALDGGDGVFHVASTDPFSGSSHHDRSTQRKLELYQFMFYMLQTKPEYLARLLNMMPVGRADETDRRLVESVILTLFGFVHTQAKREAFLFHKLLQVSVHQEILASASLDVLLDARFALTAVTTQYLRPTMSKLLQTILSEHVTRVVEADRLDLGTDPVEIYLRQINEEESATGIIIPHDVKPRNLDADQVLQADFNARAEYIQHLQELRALTDFMLQAIMSSTHLLPYSLRLLARESLLALRIKYPDADDYKLTPVVAKTVVLPFLIPAIVAPETYDIVSDTVDAVARKNLKEIARLLTFVFIQDYALDSDRFVRVPLKAYLDDAHGPVCRWILELAEVEHPEGHFQANEVIEASREARPISITRAEVYGMLGVLKRHSTSLTTSKDDTLVAAVNEIDGAPLEFDKTSPVQLRLSNRLARLPITEEQDASKADWIQAKRHVLAVLRVQTGPSLFDVLITRPEPYHEDYWAELVHRDVALDTMRHTQHPSSAPDPDGEYIIESIRSLLFHEVKSRAIEFCMRLEKTGRLRRDDQFRGLLASIASDIREKHFYRKTRSQQLKAMQEAVASTAGKKKKLQDQVDSYHSYIDSAMASLQQKGKKRTVLPFSKQFFHQRELAKSGRKPKFGSYRYTAADLYEKGVLLGVNQFSPRQFDKIFVVISSDEVGSFTIELSHPASASHPVIGSEEVRMEDLLTAQFENNTALQLFNGMASLNLNTLIFLINKKFYA